MIRRRCSPAGSPRGRCTSRTREERRWLSAYEKLERERNAIENWERVLDIDPGNTYALFSIAEIQGAGGQSRERADTLHRIIDVGAATLEDDDLITVYMQLGHIYANELQQPADDKNSVNR